ncbi:winged helix-turn-helix domain-containing protein [Bacillus toyonensis]|uniref:Winged helix-turn-helix domain-containing protein n=1 Tax=Bacillus toyonensis TaxID=155322 RepID=A0AB36T540_9BACI|nr:winged helix-turn-helix transcriptional regulator [Bacillus toyonensis]PEC09601.1 winged helix-turn-helix domain-containing protein [Bacillus toyonensis]PEN88696.1 winged helix-turn-helix domain-containing protein [Bacillus toyonensis]PHD55088.1 winged helix-turn-helix domain-containing protein [Bacillus toyonensis]
MDKQWSDYLDWRTQRGYMGLSTEEQYNEFLTEAGESAENEKLSRIEAKGLEELFEDVTVKENVQVTFDVIKMIATVGGEITYTDMANLTGYNLRTVKRHVEELVSKGYLHIKRGAHVNSYYIGNDMRATNKPKKNVRFVETFEYANGIEDVTKGVTIKDGIGEIHVTVYNIEEMLERTSRFMREVGCLYQHGNNVKKVS